MHQIREVVICEAPPCRDPRDTALRCLCGSPLRFFTDERVVEWGHLGTGVEGTLLKTLHTVTISHPLSRHEGVCRISRCKPSHFLGR